MPIILKAQEACLPEGLMYPNQQEIDSFAANHPGCATILGDVKIGTIVANLQGLSPLKEVRGDIGANPKLKNLTALSGFHTMHDIFIARNDSLSNLSGLEGITHIQDRLYISENASLTSLEVLDHPISIGGPVSIKNNPSLSHCAVQSVCDFLALAPEQASILDNASGCDTRAEVMEACGITSADSPSDEGNQVEIYPNPFQEVLYIDLAGLKSPKLKVFNSVGIPVYVRESNLAQSSINTEEWPDGTYVISLIGAGESITCKTIKASR